jgi:spore germination cell wall hydrolase CwlJ-like protein
MITAKEARELAGPNIEELVAETFEAIREAATKGKRRLPLDGQFWTYGGYNKTPEWLAAKKLLEDQGFVVTFYYNEVQFVQMYTVVKW